MRYMFAGSNFGVFFFHDPQKSSRKKFLRKTFFSIGEVTHIDITSRILLLSFDLNVSFVQK